MFQILFMKLRTDGSLIFEGLIPRCLQRGCLFTVLSENNSVLSFVKWGASVRMRVRKLRP